VVFCEDVGIADVGVLVPNLNPPRLFVVVGADAGVAGGDVVKRLCFFAAAADDVAAGDNEVPGLKLSPNLVGGGNGEKDRGALFSISKHHVRSSE
jgi:hypothetical protein